LLKEEGLIEIVEGKDIEKVKEPEDVKITGISMAKVEEKTSEFTVESTNEKGEEVKEQIKIESGEGEIFTEEKIGYSLDEIYNMVKENKALKEKIATLELKAGAVLNAKNKKYLADSLTNIQAVLDSAGTTEESIKDVDEIDYDKGDDNVIEITHDTVDDILIDETKAEPTVIELNEFEVDDEEIKNLVNEKLNYALGRVSK